MTFDVNEIISQWKVDKPKYEVLGNRIFHYLKDNITDYELLPDISFRTKELLSIIKKIKKKKAYKDYSYYDLNDKLGFRIICSFQEEMEIIDDFLKTSFDIRHIEYKRDDLNFDKLGYISNHYDACIKTSTNTFSDLVDLKDYIFEIQVRTLNQHAWSSTAHSLSYKQETNIPDGLKRKIYRLLSLYEIADDEFSTVNKILKSHPDNIVYSSLRKLEGKFYKFAKVDFDREISFQYIETILNYFDSNKWSELIDNVEIFIDDNESKIKRIFDENRIRFHEVLLLTQPEVFIIWYLLKKNPFTIVDNWGDDFSLDDLEQIKNLWGSEIE